MKAADELQRATTRATAGSQPSAETYFRAALSHFAAQRWTESLEAAKYATEIKPDFVDAWSARAMACERLSRWNDAEQAYQKVTTLRPNFTEAYCNLGGVFLKQQRWSEAEGSFAKALALKPAFPEALNGLGVARKQLGDLAGAVDVFQRALALRATYTEALFVLANTCRCQDNWGEAIAAYQQALTLNPKSVDALHNLACAQIGQRAFAKAIATLDRVLAQQPENPDVHNHLGNAHLGLSHFADASRAYERALALRPDFVDARCNLANVYLAQNLPARALEHLRTAAQLCDSSGRAASVEFNTSIALLVSGQWREGFEKYERRWDTEQKAFGKRFSAPLWLGREDLDGKTILLWAEQGIGDTLQFVRYAPALAQRGATVLLQVQPPLKALLKNFPNVAQVYSKTESPEHFDFHCPLGSLPLALGIEVDAIGTNASYIFSDPSKKLQWAGKLNQNHHFRVTETESASASLASVAGPNRTCDLTRIGLVFSGNARHKNDQNRSIPLSVFSDIARIASGSELRSQHQDGGQECPRFREGFPTAALHVIQKDLRPSDATLLSEHPELFTDWSASLTDFTETAALIDNLDLVITVDTSVAHLAGAMGKPTWVLLPFAPDWRWLLNREDTPWYPSMRLFRQSAPGDWSDTLKAVADALRASVVKTVFR
jgi:tetratricopeptide (TPR) repeat protein